MGSTREYVVSTRKARNLIEVVQALREAPSEADALALGHACGDLPDRALRLFARAWCVLAQSANLIGKEFQLKTFWQSGPLLECFTITNKDHAV